MSSVQVSRFYDSSYEFSFLWGLQPCRVYNLIGETEMTPTKQMTIRERWSWGEALRVKGSVEWSMCRAGGKTSQTGYFSAITKSYIGWVERKEEGDQGMPVLCPPSYPPKARASHVSSHSPTPHCCSCCFGSHSLLQLSGDRGLGFEGHSWMLDRQRRQGKLTLPHQSLSCSSCPYSSELLQSIIDIAA